MAQPWEKARYVFNSVSAYNFWFIFALQEYYNFLNSSEIQEG